DQARPRHQGHGHAAPRPRRHNGPAGLPAPDRPGGLAAAGDLRRFVLTAARVSVTAPAPAPVTPGRGPRRLSPVPAPAGTGEYGGTAGALPRSPTGHVRWGRGREGQ